MPLPLPLDPAVVRRELDLGDVARIYLAQLRPAGIEHVAECPFCRANGATLTISYRRRLWHCAVCHASGDPLDFIARMMGGDQRRALEVAAALLGLGGLPATVARSMRAALR